MRRLEAAVRDSMHDDEGVWRSLMKPVDLYRVKEGELKNTRRDIEALQGLEGAIRDTMRKSWRDMTGEERAHVGGGDGDGRMPYDPPVPSDGGGG